MRDDLREAAKEALELFDNMKEFWPVHDWPNTGYAKMSNKLQALLDKPSPPDMFGDIREFHEKFAIDYVGKPRALPEKLQVFRTNFLVEEFEEYSEAVSNLGCAVELGEKMRVTQELELALDSLVDLVYVALGTALLHGFDFNEAWKRVHAANMAKVRAKSTSESKRNSAMDVVKPAGWVAPSHRDLVEDNAHVDKD